MPAGDVTVKKIPATGVVAIGNAAPGYGSTNVVPAVNRSRLMFDELGIPGRVRAAGPFVLFYTEHKGDEDQGITVYVGLPVSEPPAELPSPATYVVPPVVIDSLLASAYFGDASSALTTVLASGQFPLDFGRALDSD